MLRLVVIDSALSLQWADWDNEKQLLTHIRVQRDKKRSSLRESGRIYLADCPTLKYQISLLGGNLESLKGLPGACNSRVNCCTVIASSQYHWLFVITALSVSVRAEPSVFKLMVLSMRVWGGGRFTLPYFLLLFFCSCSDNTHLQTWHSFWFQS